MIVIIMGIMELAEVLKKMINNENIRNTTVIFTHSWTKAKTIIDKIAEDNKDDIKSYIISRKSLLLYLKNGDRFLYYPVSEEYQYGIRCNKAYIDKTINIQIMNDVVLPMLFNCKSNDIIYF